MTIRVAVIPRNPDLEQAVLSGGGVVVASAAESDAVVWADPGPPERLGATLEGSAARWVQLPSAGIEEFLAAGVIDTTRTWTCARAIYGRTTAEHALALILAAARALHVHARGRTWIESTERSALTRREIHSPRILLGTSAVIVGTGGIGGSLVKMLTALEVHVIGVNRSGIPRDESFQTISIETIDEVLGQADWVALAAPMTPATSRLFDSRRLSLMNKKAWLINVARGGLVDTEALVEALISEKIAGAALDVTEPEPLPSDHRLWSLHNVIITSHMANTTGMILPALCQLVERNTRRFANGEQLEGIVDLALGY